MGRRRLTAAAALALLPMIAATAAASGRLALATATAAASHDLVSTPRALSTPMPTQYETAMMETLNGVKEGRVPDPATRKPDGSPGTLLNALLPPQQPSEEDRASTRRQLAAAWRLIGAKVPFASGPTFSSFNMSFYRYASVAPLQALDWRQTSYVTPVMVQYNCASCWVGAPADLVAMGSAIASGNTPLMPGIQQYCDCGGGTCCQGGWPEDAFNWITAQGNITTNDFYNYWAQDNRTCTLGDNYPIAGNITGWERVPIYSQSALMKAVNMQPVMVYISASSPDFIAYNSTAPGTPGFNVYNGNCSTEINHAVIVLGYNTQASVPYWIIKNSWPSWGWGDNGYMYLAMTGDGTGKCGIQTVAPLYPVNFPTAPRWPSVVSTETSPDGFDDFPWNTWQPSGDPCANVINPCGSGMCIAVGGLARCSCPAPFVEVVGIPTSKCVEASPCTNSQFNPCGAGTCLDIGDGGYVCSCPYSYTVGAQANGNPTCIPLSKVSNTSTYTVQFGDSCASIAAAYGISVGQLKALNTFLKCKKKYIVPGRVLVVPTQTQSICSQLYAVRPGDTCRKIAYNMDKNANFLNWLQPSFWGYNASSSSNNSTPPTLLGTVPALTNNTPGYSTASLTQINPALDCTNLYNSEQVCVASPSVLDTKSVDCGATYTSVQGDTCASVQSDYNLTSSYFLTLNPGINCKKKQGQLVPGLQLCVAPVTYLITSISNCSQYYTVQQGDSCAQIWNAANLSQFQFLYINPGLRCQDPYLFVGQPVCINSSALVNIPDPNYFIYTVQVDDTLATIQSQFTQKCQSYSITFDRLASQNGFSDWTTWTPQNGSVIVIPCVPRIGATCGCIPSQTVCGGDFVNYPSYCDATCNFASPITTGSCSGCQSACAGRYGTAPNPTSACAAGYTCPYPVWPPAVTDASKVFTCTTGTGGQCLCKYRQQTCTSACAVFANTVSGGSSSTCYNNCYHCGQVPCGGPSIATTATSSWCGGSCTSTATNVPCNPSGRGCVTQCAYWNNWWLTYSTTTPKFNP